MAKFACHPCQGDANKPILPEIPSTGGKNGRQSALSICSCYSRFWVAGIFEHARCACVFTTNFGSHGNTANDVTDHAHLQPGVFFRSDMDANRSNNDPERSEYSSTNHNGKLARPLLTRTAAFRFLNLWVRVKWNATLLTNRFPVPV